MRIGIDFDNTIASYDQVFHETAVELGWCNKDTIPNKASIKDCVVNLPDGQSKWQALQGKVYGPLMHKARLFPGLGRFLLASFWLGHTIFIISHKTKFGHFDETKTPLRDTSLEWMRSKSFFDSKEYNLREDNVFFANTRIEKVNIIETLKLDVMIDDLPEVFTTEGFPEIKKIVFRSHEFYSWQKIFDELFGPISQNFFVKSFFNHMMASDHAIDVKRINNGINSGVWAIKDSDGAKYAIKFYPDRQLDRRPRVSHEKTGIKFFSMIQPELRIVRSRDDLDVNILTWVNGKVIKRASSSDIKEMVKITKKLVAISKRFQTTHYLMASEHCISLSMLIEQIEKRISKLNLIENPLLETFFSEFETAYKQAKEHADKHWPKNNKTLPLETKNLILSPSDFGFHNAVRKKSGKLVFLDFEYFGWDDPVKLYCDTLLHPGLKLDYRNKTMLAKSLWSVFFQYEDFEKRVNASWPLFGLRWSLILLNSFLKLPEKLGANNDFYSHEEYLVSMISQQKKALDLVRFTKSNKCGVPYAW